MKIAHVICISMLLLCGATVASSDEISAKVYPDSVDEILYQRDLHGATQAYLWGQAIASSGFF